MGSHIFRNSWDKKILVSSDLQVERFELDWYRQIERQIDRHVYSVNKK